VIPAGFFAARCGAGKRASRDAVGWPHRIQWIGYGQNHVWSSVQKKNPPWVFRGECQVLDVLSQRDGVSATASRRQGSTAVTQPAPQQGMTESKTRQGKGRERPLDGRRRTTARRRSAATRHGMVGCTVAAFAWARAHGGIQILGAYAWETSESKRV
jgi:hypothetical protein